MTAKNNDDLTTRFLDLYEQWARYLAVRFKTDSMFRNTRYFWDAERNRAQKLGISEGDLLGLFNLRNVGTHAPSFAEIQPAAVVKMEKLVSAFCRKAIDIATREKEIYKVGLDKKIGEVIKQMSRQKFTHVPVIDGDNFVGVFSENSLLELIADGKFSPEIKVGDIKEYLTDIEGADEYEFLAVDADFHQVHYLFNEYIEKGKRLGVVFLTAGGQPSAEIKGLITAWDLYKGSL